MLKNLLITSITFYQKYLSPDTGILKRIGVIRKPVCGMYPTCSEYTKQAIEKYGSGQGFVLGIKRIARCHPWQKNHFDPVP